MAKVPENDFFNFLCARTISYDSDVAIDSEIIIYLHSQVQRFLADVSLDFSNIFFTGTWRSVMSRYVCLLCNGWH